MKTKTIDGVFGPSDEFTEGFLEGMMKSVPFTKATRDAANAIKEQNKDLTGPRYSCGKALSVYTVACAYPGIAFTLYDILK